MIKNKFANTISTIISTARTDFGRPFFHFVSFLTSDLKKTPCCAFIFDASSGYDKVQKKTVIDTKYSRNFCKNKKFF